MAENMFHAGDIINMQEAYGIAQKRDLESVKRARKHDGLKLKSLALIVGGRVLVRNLSERGGPGKFMSHREDKIHVVRRQISRKTHLYMRLNQRFELVESEYFTTTYCSSASICLWKQNHRE
jgi:hypothetical protein